MFSLPTSISKAIDTIAEYLSLYFEDFAASWEFYDVKLKKKKKWVDDIEEVKMNDEFNILKDL